MKLIFLLLVLNTSYASIPHIKVRLAQNQKFIKVSGKKLTNSLVVSGNNRQYRNQKVIVFDCQKTRSNLGSDLLKVAEVSSAQSVISWKKKNFFGNFVIVGNQNTNSCDLIQKMDMESYVSGVVAKEMRSDWPIEALKAQAVTARSYALFKIKTLQQESGKQIYHLENSEKHQVIGSLEDQSYLTHRASSETFGEVLTYQNRQVPTFFHSKCGGKTLLPQDVWENSVSGYESVYCPYCHKHGKKPWKISLGKQNLNSYMTSLLDRYYPGQKWLGQNLALASDYSEKKNLSFKGKDYIYLRKSDLRKKLGREKLPSNLFQIHSDGNNYTIAGKGYGHGVGMCQYGAYELARRGYSYRQILKHYFPNFELKKVY